MSAETTNQKLIQGLESFPPDWLRKGSNIMAQALITMLSAETDWYDGEIGVGHRFRVIARKAIEDVLSQDLV